MDEGSGAGPTPAIDYFCANRESDPYFAALLEDVKEAGVPIEVVRCSVNKQGMTIDCKIPFR